MISGSSHWFSFDITLISLKRLFSLVCPFIFTVNFKLDHLNMKFRYGLISILVIFSSFICSAKAQQLRPLTELIGDADITLPLLRCSGLYLAMTDRFDKTRMGESLWNNAEESRKKLLVIAAVLRQKQSGDTYTANVDNSTRDMINVADLYIERMKNNFARSGQDYNEDSDINDDSKIAFDLKVCKVITLAAIGSLNDE